MAVPILVYDDLIPRPAGLTTEVAQVLITDALARAVIYAPCLADPEKPDEVTLAAAKAILRGAVLRAAESPRVEVTQAAGPFSVTPKPYVSLYRTEADELRALCAGVAAARAQSRARFPAPEPVEDLFVRRPTWPRLVD